jgi:hemoglobin
MTVRRPISLALCLAATLFLAACMQPEKPASLYDRLGGKPAITAVVDQFVANIAADSRINQRFAKTDIPKLKGHLVDQICEATGGPCKYAGRDMVTTHKGMNVTQGEFDATGQALAAALDKFNVPAAEKNQLLAAIGGMRNDIVGK